MMVAWFSWGETSLVVWDNAQGAVRDKVQLGHKRVHTDTIFVFTITIMLRAQNKADTYLIFHVYLQVV